MHPNQIRGANGLSFNQVIGFGCICTRRDFWPIENQNCIHDEIGHSKSLRGMTIPAKCTR